MCVLDWCDREATEADGLCFPCSEEVAVLVADAAVEFADVIATRPPATP